MVKENEEYESDDGSPGRRRAQLSRNDLLVSSMTDGFKKHMMHNQKSPAQKGALTP